MPNQESARFVARASAPLTVAALLSVAALNVFAGSALAQDGKSDPKVDPASAPKTSKPAASREYGEPLRAALAAFEKGDWAGCVESAGLVPAGNPDKARAHYLTGEAELQRGDAASAVTAFRAAAALRKDSVPVLVGLARALTRTDAAGKGGEEAEKLLRRAVTLDGKDVSAKRSLGELLVARGDLAAGRKEIEAAHKLAPTDGATVRSLIEVLLAAAAEKEAALDTARQVAAAYAKAAPEAPLAWFLTGLVADRKGDAADAIRDYEKAIALDDRFLDAHKNLAILCMARNPVYRDTERLQKSLDHYERYFALGGKDAVLEEQYRTLLQFVVRDESGGAPRLEPPGSGNERR